MKRPPNPTHQKQSELTAEQQEIVRRLYSIYGSERISAEQALAKMGSDAIPLLYHVLASPMRIVQLENRLSHILMAGGTILPAPLAWAFGYIPLSWVPVGILFTFPFSTMLLGVGRMIWAHYISLRTFRPAQEAALRVLAGCEDVQAIGLLAETVHALIPDYGVRGTAALHPALIRLLPQMCLADYLALTEYQKNCLYLLLRANSAFVLNKGQEDGSIGGVLRNKHDCVMTLELLNLYGRVGDTRAISYIERLVSVNVLESSHEVEKVIEAAGLALDGMKAREQEWESASTHLRASSAPKAADDELLIPASGAAPAEAQELLRASKQGSEKETAE